MPSQYVHVACGQEALRNVGGRYGDIDVLSFNLGCQGPDIFSHNRHTRPLALAYARLLHRRRYGDFCFQLANAIADSGDVSLISWFLGFLTHATVDRELHPYVICRSTHGERDVPRTIERSRLHAFLERILDSAIQAHRAATAPHEDALDARVCVPEGLAEPLTPIIAGALAAVYGEKAGDRIEDRVMNAFSDAGNLYRILDPDRLSMSSNRCGPELARIIAYGPNAVSLLQPESVPRGTDWLNVSHAPWPDPVSGTVRTESVLELAELAVRDAGKVLKTVMNPLFARGSFETLAETVGNGCLSLRDSVGAPAPVSYYEPFDLVPLLLEQSRLRSEWALG